MRLHDDEVSVSVGGERGDPPSSPGGTGGRNESLVEWSGERGGITPLIISPIKTAEKYKLGSGARELTSPIQANNGSFPLGSQGGLWGEEGEEREGM